MLVDMQQYIDKPVKTIIYTHGHPDHRGGASAFRETVEEIIAFSNKQPSYQYTEKVNTQLSKRGIYQFGYELSDKEAIDVKSSS